MRFVEYTSALAHHSRVDREAGVIRDVLILGSHSANGRTYTADAMTAAARLYEGVPVYIDHQPEGRRSYRDKIGRLVSVAFRDGGLRGDLHVNPAHPAAAQLFWDAEHHPAAVGLSHDAEGRIITRDGQAIVEAIESVRSVDLVAEPATTRTLFEGMSMPSTLREQEPTEAPAVDPLEALYQSLTLEALADKRPDLLEALRKQVQQEIATPMQALKQQLDELRAKLDEYTTAEAADQQMAEAKLDPARVPPRLREAIRRERSPQRRAALIEDVQRLIGSSGQQPLSVSGWPASQGDIKDRLTNWRI